MLMTRRLAEEEGMFLGGSCGMAMAGALQWIEAHRDELSSEDVGVVIMPDGGYRSLGKVFNDVWMQEHGFLGEGAVPTAGSVVAERAADRALVSVPADMTLDEAIGVMREHAISQVPVMEGDEVVGSLIEQDILSFLIGDPDARARLVRDLMAPPFPIVDAASPVRAFAGGLGGDRPAVLVRNGAGALAILTRSDLIGTLGA